MIRKLIGVVVTAIICTGAVSAAGLAVAPCAQCHADGKVLGENHPSVVQAKTLDDCMMCHQKAAPALSAMLHAKHTEKAPCSMCHEVKDGKLFAKGVKTPLGEVSEDLFDLYAELGGGDVKGTARLHETKNLSCVNCHGVKTPQEGAVVDNAVCEKCHGAQADLAKRTVPKIKEQNPHASHQGALTCSKCHAGHSTPKSYCLECHNNFDQVMPESKILN